MKTIFTILIIAASVMSRAQTTSLTTTWCGANVVSFSDFIETDSIPGANHYEFRLVNGAYTGTWINSSGFQYLALYLVPGISYGTTYSIDVRWSGDAPQATPSNWSAWGPTCLITSPSTEMTTFEAGTCATYYTSWTALISAEERSGVDSFEFRLSNINIPFTGSVRKGNKNFNLSQISGLTQNTSYDIAVRVKLFGVWNPYSAGLCVIATPINYPTTKLETASCNITATAWDQLIYCDDYLGDSVRFRLTKASPPYTQVYVKGNNNFILSQFTGLTAGAAYDVDCSVRWDGIWRQYGAVCSITTPAAPTSSIVPGECGSTATSYTNQLFHCENVTGFEEYEYEFTNTGLSYTGTLQKSNNNNFILAQITPTPPLGATFDVRVRVKFMGVYGPFGNTCQITTPGSYQRGMATGIQEYQPESTNTPTILIDIYGRPYTGQPGLYFEKRGDKVKLINKE